MSVLPILQRLVQENRFPSAILIQGSLADTTPLVQAFLQWACCEQHQACGQCQPCIWLREGHHPDVMEVVSHQVGHAIKIEQIRELQEWAYQSSTAANQWGVIHDASSMNLHSANALLKILEEPSLKTHFILTAENEKLLPPTILSRCVRFECRGLEKPTEHRAQLLDLKSEFLSVFRAFLKNEADLNQLLIFFQTYTPDDSLWFLQQVCADVVSQRLCSEVSSDELEWMYAKPLASWWAFWDALLHYRQQIKMGVHFHESLLLSQLFLSLTTRSSHQSLDC